LGRLKNSAYDRLNNTDPKHLAFFHTSETGYISEYGIYNSTGQLLKGDELFEQYTELAKQLDTKRSAFYLSLKEKEIIFGCSLVVKADNGREERVVFIQVNKNLSLGYYIESNIHLLKQFYEAVKFEIETFELKKYQLIGLWNEGDFRNIKEVSLKKGILEYTVGKISAGKRVSVKISELSNGLSLILKLIVRSRNSLPLVFDVSQYPSESDVSVSLIKPNPDFEIGESGNLPEFIRSESWIYYEKLGEKLFKDELYSKGSKNRSDYISPIVKMILEDPKNYYSSSNSILDEFDDGEKVEIFRGLIQNINDKNDADITKILINIYAKIKESKHRKDIHIILFSNNIYIKELIKDLIITIYDKHDNDFFNVLFIDNTSLDNSSIKYSGKTYDEWEGQQKRKTSRKGSKYSFEKGIDNALKDLDYSEKVNFVKFIAREAPSKPEEKGRFLLESLITDLVVSQGNKDFILELSDKELKNLGEIRNEDILTTKRELKKKKRDWIIKPVFYTGLLVAIVFIAFSSYNFLMGGNGAVNLSSGNQTNISKLNETDFGKVDINSSSGNQTNISKLNETDFGKVDINSSSDNKTNTSKLNETDFGKGNINSSSNNKTNNSTDIPQGLAKI
jgi:hypothetical protein